MEWCDDRKKDMDVEKERQPTNSCAKMEIEMQKEKKMDGCNKVSISRRSRYRRGVGRNNSNCSIDRIVPLTVLLKGDR